MALCPRVLIWGLLTLRVYNEERTIATYTNKHLESCSNVSLVRTRAISKRTRVLLRRFGIKGREGQYVSSDRRRNKVCLKTNTVGSAYMMIAKHLFWCCSLNDFYLSSFLSVLQRNEFIYYFWNGCKIAKSTDTHNVVACFLLKQ